MKKTDMVAIGTIAMVACLFFCTPALANYNYNGFPVVTRDSGTVNGGVFVDYVPWDGQTTLTGNFNVPTGNIIWARLYAGIWGGRPEYEGWVNVTFNDDYNSNGLGPIHLQGANDANSNVWCSGYGKHWIYYTVTDLVTAGAVNTATTTKINATAGTFDGRVYGIVLVVVYEGGANPKNIQYWINDGSDGLNDQHNAGTTVFAGSVPDSVTNAELTMVHLTAYNPGCADCLQFNDNVLDTSMIDSNTFEFNSWDVASHVESSGNDAWYSRGGDGHVNVCNAILTLESEELPDLIVTDINAYHYNTISPAWFNLLNEIDVTVKNNGSAAAGASTVCLYIDNVSFGDLPVSSLDVDKEETVTFTGWNPIGDDCQQQPCTYEDSFQDYDVRAVADCDGNVAESNETNNEITVVERACYNGYMADEPLENVAQGTIHGHIIFTTGDGSYGCLNSPGNTRATNYDITLPESATVEHAQLNVYYTWVSPDHACPEMEVSITNPTGTHIVSLEKAYNDIKCTCPGTMYVKSWGNYVFDIADYVTGSGIYTVTVKNVGPSGHKFCLAAPGIVLVYADESAPLIDYWVNKGADVLLGGCRGDGGYLSLEECINDATFPASATIGEVATATLGVVAPWGDSAADDVLYFNDIDVGSGVYNGYSSPYDETIDSITMSVGGSNAQVGVDVTDVTTLYNEGSENVVGQGDDGNCMMPANAFLVVAYEEEELPDLNVTEITPNCGYLFASESNEICAKIENIGGGDAGAFNVSFDIDGFSTEVRITGLAAGANTTVCVNDTTSRNAGDPVTITVIADCDGEVTESDEENNVLSLATTVVNNGYKGKRYTGGSDINTWDTFELNGNLIYSLGDSYYLSSYSYPDWTEYNARWDASQLPIPGTATIETARLFVPYTWDKTGGIDTYVAMSFNDNLQTLDAYYSDEKGWGSSNYPYGMLVYDVTADFDTSGNVANLTNSYPGGDNVSMRGMLLVVVYADDSEPERTILMNEEFDLLYGGADKCTTPEEATAYAPFGSIDTAEVKEATLITVAPGAGDPAEGDLSFNGQMWNDAWDFVGTGTPTPQIGIAETDVTSYLQATDNEANFQSSADWMEASNAFLILEKKEGPKPDLNVTEITPNCGYLFASESNEICAKIENIGGGDAGAFNVSFDIDGFSTEVRISGLAAGANTTVCVNDTMIRNAGESMTITVTADCNYEVDESDEENNESTLDTTVVNNGYKGKRYTGGDDINTWKTFELNGNLIYSLGDSYYLSSSTNPDWTEYNVGWTASNLPIPGTATIETARLFVPYTWDKAGVMPTYAAMSFNGNLQTLDAHYSDEKSWGTSYPYGMLVYDVTAEFEVSGNVANLTNSCPGGDNVSMRGMLLVVVYADSSEPERTILLNEEFDLLYGGSYVCTTPEEATAYAPFGSIDTAEVKEATLITVAPGAGDPAEGDLSFNGQMWNDAWDFVGTGTPTPQIGIAETDVTSYLQATDNEANFQSSADWMEASNAFLILEKKEGPKPDLNVTEITPNCGYLFASESNEICAKIENIGGGDAGAFNVSFDIDGFSTEVRITGLAAGANTTVCIDDTTIRTADDFVTITVTADCNYEVDESDETNNVLTLATTVVNNGYKGKRYTGGDDINTWDTFELNGNLIYSLGDSYYLSSYSYPDWTEYNARWDASELPIPGTATIETARLFVPYTWDKTGVMPTSVSMSFNGNLQTLDAHYSDEKGWGSSYPYGMLVYDVTADFDTSGNVANLTNSYPGGGGVSMRGMLLVVVYADDSEPERTILMNEEFDLLYGGASKCTTPEEATAYAPFGSIDTAEVGKATLITFAPGAGPNEGDLLFNGQIWNDVWSFATAAQIGIDERDVTSYLRPTDNEAGFQSSGDYMEASNAFLIVTETEKINETEYQKKITQPVDVSKIRYKFTAVNEEWAALWTTVLLYGQHETKYSIEIRLNKAGYVTRVDFERWGFPIAEIPVELATQSLAKLNP